MIASPNIRYSGVILDILLIFFLLFGDKTRTWVADHLVVSYASVGILQVLAVASAVLGFTMPPITKLDTWFDNHLIGLKGLMTVLCFGAFMWFFIPMEVIDRPGLLVFNFAVSLFGSFFALGFILENKQLLDKWWFRAILDVGVLLYLVASESILMAVAGDVETGVVVFGLLFSWIPIRIMLLLRPPLTLLEFFSSAAMLGVFFYKLFST